MQFNPSVELSGKKIYFLHIPKTAGTTFTDLLEQYYSSAETCPDYYWAELFQHPIASLKDYLNAFTYFRGHFGFNLKMLFSDEPVTLTFLRNPIDRVLSQWNHLKQLHDDDYWAEKLPERYSIESMLSDTAFSNYQTRLLSGKFHPVNAAKNANPPFQEHVISEIQTLLSTFPTHNMSDAEMLDNAKYNLEHIDFLGITEQFEESLKLFANLFGIPIPRSFRNRRVSSTRQTSQDLPPNILEKLIELNQIDIELYDFAQKIFNQRLQELRAEKWSQEEAYRHKFLQKYGKQEYIDYDLARVMPGTGWYPLEANKSYGDFRWTGPENVSFIDLPLSFEKNLMIEVGVIGAMSDAIFKSLKLYINGTFIETRSKLKHDMSTVFYGQIPREAIAKTGGFARIELHVAETQNETNTDDTRQMGIATNHIRVFPIADV